MNIGDQYTQTIVVREQDSAMCMGSGTLPVFATPAMVAYMENTAMQVVKNELPDGSDTVGIVINVNHTKASPIGASVTISAQLTATEGRKLTFSIEAKDEKGDVIGTAIHQRFIIDKERFLSKLK